MNTGGLILIVGALIASAAAFIWVALKIENGPKKSGSLPLDDLEKAAQEDVGHIFNDDFREELRNRGRLHFAEITRTLQEEFKKYEQSITDAKQIALESIEKTVTTIEQQRQFLEQQLKAQSDAQKSRIIKRFEEEMASIVNHYILKAIGNQIDLSDQLDFILSEMETNKKAIIEDISNGTS
jgi:uncharacterized protein YbcC (UPF0753/DUF2309 family)